MRCLVTGGAGFIGSHVVDALLEAGHEVVIADDLSTGRMENVNPKANFIKGDLAESSFADYVTRDIGWVFHLAALARVQRSVDDPVGTTRANVTATVNLLKGAVDHGITKFIYSSSSSVYGLQDTHVMVETMKPNPLSPYALQKWQGEEWTKMFHDLYGLSCVNLRYFNVYGPRQVLEGAYSLVIGKFLAQKAQGHKMTIYGDGEQTRAYTYVKDVARANLLAAQSYQKYATVNIGTTVETSVNQIAEMIGGEVEHIMPNPRGKFEEVRKVANNDLAMKLIGWRPLVTFEEGMKQL